MRLRRKPWVDEAIHEFDDFVVSRDQEIGEEKKGKWSEIFGRKAPLHVVLGTGKGDFISQLAELHPDINYIGIEMQQDVLYSAAKKIAEKEPQECAPARLRHQSHRGHLRRGRGGPLLHQLLRPVAEEAPCQAPPHACRLPREVPPLAQEAGRAHFKTDNRPLFDFSLEQFEEAGFRVQDVSYDLHAENRSDNIMTEYERKFSGFGEKINRCEVIFE